MGWQEAMPALYTMIVFDEWGGFLVLGILFVIIGSQHHQHRADVGPAPPPGVRRAAGAWPDPAADQLRRPGRGACSRPRSARSSASGWASPSRPSSATASTSAASTAAWTSGRWRSPGRRIDPVIVPRRQSRAHPPDPRLHALRRRRLVPVSRAAGRHHRRHRVDEVRTVGNDNERIERLRRAHVRRMEDLRAGSGGGAGRPVTSA